MQKKSPPWYSFAKKFYGKKETDPEFNKFMVSKWKMVGLRLSTIATSGTAWCGLAMAVALGGVGLDWAEDGGRARRWAGYGLEIEWKKNGIPQGAIIHLNHSLNCKNHKSNHVTQANGDCSASDLLSKDATFDGYGGNQGNTWKVSTYQVKEICNVRWPISVTDPLPEKITQSKNCSSKRKSDGTTR